MLFKRVFISILLFTLCFSEVRATHIVGGDFYYDYLGSNVYRITLKLYVDCINGRQNAIDSDREAIIGIFDAGTNQFEKQFIMTRTSPERLNKLNYECVRPPTDVCVDGYTYEKILTIDPGRDGKILAFQRCCRNNTITNILYPESTGSTYWIKIPPANLAVGNNAARFKELPPNYLCTDAPLVFDHSAYDPDGDSLIYMLYQPYLGATQDKPRPDNSDMFGYQRPPPFASVVWKTPYHTYNQMGGNPGLAIDRKTGELTVIPTTVGQFVIGIKVLEFRRGVLIGETYRDYQFNVKHCTFDLISAFTAPVFSCSDTVRFVNKSYKAVQYRWNFGDPSTEADTSHEVNPTYVYPGNGDYRVTLKATNEVCEDVYVTTVRIRSNIKLNLGPDLVFCNGVDRFLDTRCYDATKVLWSNGMSGPTIRARDTGMYRVQVFYDQCEATDSIHLSEDPVKFSLPPDSLFCEDVNILIDAGVRGYKFRWSPSPRDTFPTLQVNKPGWYWVRVSNKYCYEVDSIQLLTSIKPQIGPYYFVCNEFVHVLDGGGRPGSSYLWQDGSRDRYFTATRSGTYHVQVREKHCVSSDTVHIENPRINLELGLDSHYCDVVKCQLMAPEQMRRYTWQDGSVERIFPVNEAGTYFVEVEDTNGCIKSDTVRFTMSISPEITLGPDTSICARMGIELSPGDGFQKYVWNTGPDDSGPTRYIESEGIYEVEVTDNMGCTGTAGIRVKVDPDALPNDLFIPNAISANNDQLNEVFPFSFLIDQPEFRARVFNRWGEKLFDTQTDGRTWNAQYGGSAAQVQAYMYLVEYRGCDGNFRRKSGTLTVLR